MDEIDTIKQFCILHQNPTKENMKKSRNLLFSVSKETKQFLLKASKYLLDKNKGNKKIANNIIKILDVDKTKYEKLLKNSGYIWKYVIERGKTGTGVVVEKDNLQYVAKFYDKITTRRLKQEIQWQEMAAEKGISPNIVFSDINNKFIIMEKLDETLVENFIRNGGCVLPINTTSQLLRIFTILDSLNILHSDPGLSNFMFKNDKLYIIDFGDAIQKKQKKSNYFILEEIYNRILKITMEVCRNIVTDKDYNINNLEYKTINKSDVFYRGTVTKAKYDPNKLDLSGIRWVTPDFNTAIKYTDKKKKSVIQKFVVDKPFKVIYLDETGAKKLLKYVYATKNYKLLILLSKAFFSSNHFFFTCHCNINNFEKYLNNIIKSGEIIKKSDLNINNFKLKRKSDVTIDGEFMEELCKLGVNGYYAPELYAGGFIFPREMALCTTSKFLRLSEFKDMKPKYYRVNPFEN